MRILVTGGAGSIGSECARRLLALGHAVRIVDVNEEGLWLLSTELPRIDCVLGDVQFPEDLAAALDGMEAIIHCAAYKHVHFCERSLLACNRVNADAVRLLMEMAHGRRVVLLSSDKAVGPHCAMGRAKRWAESVVIQRGGNGSVVRFGNVIGSRGSLVPAVLRYKALKRPIPITDERMTRFFMGIREAVDLILAALGYPEPGQTVVPEAVRSAKVLEFLEVCRDAIAPECEIERVGARPGERLHETMELRDGTRVRSDEPACLMTRDEISGLLRAELYPNEMVAA